MGTPLHPLKDLFAPRKNRELFVGHTPTIFHVSIKNALCIDATILGLYLTVYFTVIHVHIDSFFFFLISSLLVELHVCLNSFNKDPYTNVGEFNLARS